MTKKVAQSIDVAQILKSQMGYDPNRVIELMIEEYRLSPQETAQLVKQLYGQELPAIEIAELLSEFFDDETSWQLIESSFDFSQQTLKGIHQQVFGIFNEPVTFKTTVTKVRANDFGHEYRAYIYLKNIGSGQSGWGYLTPDNVGTDAIMHMAIDAKVSGLEIYVYGKIDTDGKKIKILELGLV